MNNDTPSADAADRIYQDTPERVRPFEFNEQVAAVFPDMIRRSVPGYQATLTAIGRLAARHLVDGTRGYDLGCSLGAALLAMRHGSTARNAELVGIDNSEAMLQRCRSILDADAAPLPVTLELSDVRAARIENASMVVLNYTLQFVPPEDRNRLLEGIRSGMSPGGVLVLSEKIRFDDGVLNDLVIGLHEDFKRANAYSEMEISRKRTALENVLIPDTLEALSERLLGAGFRSCGVWLQQYNFVSMVAVP